MPYGRPRGWRLRERLAGRRARTPGRPSSRRCAVAARDNSRRQRVDDHGPARVSSSASGSGGGSVCCWSGCQGTVRWWSWIFPRCHRTWCRRQSRARLSIVVWPPSARCCRWWASHMAGGRVQPRAVQCRSRAASARRCGGGDGVAQRLEAVDLSGGGEQHLRDPGVAEQRFDAGSGLRSGPGCGGAGLLRPDPTSAGQRGRDGVGERRRLVVGAARSAGGAGGSGVLGGGPVGGQDVAELRAQAAAVGQGAVPQDLFGEVDEGVGAALPGGARVLVAGCAGERFQGGEERLAVLGGNAGTCRTGSRRPRGGG